MILSLSFIIAYILIIVNNATNISINDHIILAFIIPPKNIDMIVKIFNIAMLVLFLVKNLRLLSP